MVSVPHAARALTDALQGTRRKRSVEGRLADQGRATDVRFQTAQRPHCRAAPQADEGQRRRTSLASGMIAALGGGHPLPPSRRTEAAKSNHEEQLREEK